MPIDPLFEKIFVPLIAALLGGVIGAIAAFRYQNKAELKREKRQVFHILMMNRNIAVDELDWIKHVNVIPSVYHDNPEVIQLLRAFMAQTEANIIHTLQHVETYNKMLLEMAKTCGYKNLNLADIRESYTPAALEAHFRHLRSTPHTSSVSDSPVHSNPLT